MGLPPALAARLAKRGLITSSNDDRKQDEEEEVIAENYDAPSAADDNNDEFGNLLPPDWEKVFNAEHGTWYYWDTTSGKVSWLPPSDPEAFITYPADSVKQLAVEEPPPMINIDSIPLPSMPPAPVSVKDNTTRGGKRDSARIDVKTAAKKKRTHDDEFDPMDPSAYSDAPKGNWATGLKKLDDAKTGVDSTANGPLFQQRPYPSPGEVLRRNTQARQEVGPAKPW